MKIWLTILLLCPYNEQELKRKAGVLMSAGSEKTVNN